MSAADRAWREREGWLAPFAARGSDSRGRRHAESESRTRSPFQRDRDRIIHSTAFRRLEYKTQVFVYHEGDHYRTRLTHSLEVAQIARSLARALKLDEDLAEACALAHDLGHPPFGHAGEAVLDEMMADYGGFDHNAQTIRIVTLLERRYAAFPGLNLTFETLEGLAKHNGPLDGGKRDDAVLKAVEEAGLADHIAPTLWPPLEAQLAAIADDLAYTAHDIDDGLRAGLFALDALADLALTCEPLADVRSLHPASRTITVHELVRRVIDRLVTDLVDETRRRLAARGIADPAGVRHAAGPLVAFSGQMRAALEEMRRFLTTHMYRNRYVVRGLIKAKKLVRRLFALYIAEPHCLPAEWEARCDGAHGTATARVVADFIAGMTDRYAIREYRRLFDITEYPV